MPQIGPPSRPEASHPPTTPAPIGCPKKPACTYGPSRGGFPAILEHYSGVLTSFPPLTGHWSGRGAAAVRGCGRISLAPPYRPRRLPHWPQTSRACQSGTGVPAHSARPARQDRARPGGCTPWTRRSRAHRPHRLATRRARPAPLSDQR